MKYSLASRLTEEANPHDLAASTSFLFGFEFLSLLQTLSGAGSPISSPLGEDLEREVIADRLGRWIDSAPSAFQFLARPSSRSLPRRRIHSIDELTNDARIRTFRGAGRLSPPAAPHFATRSKTFSRRGTEPVQVHTAPLAAESRGAAHQRRFCKTTSNTFPSTS